MAYVLFSVDADKGSISAEVEDYPDKENDGSFCLMRVWPGEPFEGVPTVRIDLNCDALQALINGLKAVEAGL